MIFPFKGLMAPILTPFAEDSQQSLMLENIPEYATYLVTVQNIKGALVNGTSGEGMSMTVNERNSVVEAWVAASKNLDLTLMVQVGGACLKDVQTMARHAAAHGVAGLLCLPDLFNKPATEEDLVRYLKHVSTSAPKTPLLYYHMPSYTNVNLNMAKFFSLAAKEIPTFSGAKFTHTNLEEGARVLAVAERHELSVFLGCDTIMAGAYALGFDSAIATTLNMFADPSHRILAEMKNGNTSQALLQQRRLTEVINGITRNGLWVPTMKEAMNSLTPIQVGKPRPPLQAITAEQIKQMELELNILGLSK